MVPEVSDQTSPALVVVSNRGPVSFRDDEGELVAQRGSGGLISTLGPAAAESGALWIAAAMTDEDRRATAESTIDAEGFTLRLLDIDDRDYKAFYDVVANTALWFLHHGLFDLARRPRIDRRWREAWDAYRRVNDGFAAAVAQDAPPGAVVLVHDYHLTLLGKVLSASRPDLRTVHFHHTPFTDPVGLRILPDDVAVELLEGLAGHRACGFHSPRWAAAFEACCREVLGRAPTTFVAPAAADHDDIAKVAASERTARELESLDAKVSDRQLIVRVDRIELSKNLLRGFLAFDDLLETYPQWREHVMFGAYIYPSRENLPEYLAYRHECDAIVERLNNKWGTERWTPILLDPSDDFPRSVAALRRYDVLLVNPVRDGLNLVAKEGALVNERNGVLALSREAGAWDELGGAALEVNPFDVAGTADVLHRALSMSASERGERAARLRACAAARTPADWLEDLMKPGLA